MLSPAQIKALAIEARKAWSALKPAQRAEIVQAAGDSLNDPLISEAKAFDWWRRQEQKQVTGKASLREMCNDDFNLIKSRWLFLQGKIKDSLMADIAATEEDCRQLRFCIKEACQLHELPIAYAEKICQNKSGHKLEHADARILQQVLYTLNNRGRHSERRKPSETPKPKIDKKGKLPPPRGFYATGFDRATGPDSTTFIKDGIMTIIEGNTVRHIQIPF